MSHHKLPSLHWPIKFALLTDKDEVQSFTCFSKVEAGEFADYSMTCLSGYTGVFVNYRQRNSI